MILDGAKGGSLTSTQHGTLTKRFDTVHWLEARYTLRGLGIRVPAYVKHVADPSKWANVSSADAASLFL
jgi:hypothetical protein